MDLDQKNWDLRASSLPEGALYNFRVAKENFGHEQTGCRSIFRM